MPNTALMQPNMVINNDIEENSIEPFYQFCIKNRVRITFPANTNSKYNYIKQTIGMTPSASITISYRDEGIGKGAFYDHYTLQRSTKHHTECSLPQSMKTSDLNTAIRQSTPTLTFGVPQPKNLGKTTPPISTDQISDVGLLVIPGRARDTETKRPNVHQARTQHERNLLAQAKKIGRPVLALCAGSWELWKTYGGQLRSVTDHNHGSGMPRISQTHGNIIYNGDVHRISITPNSIIAGAMKYDSSAINLNEKFPKVNSVHWMAPDHTSIPPILAVTVRSKRDDSVAPKSRQGHLMEPDNDTVEGFETETGVPQVGIQWHPEAYDKPNDLQSQKHCSLLQYMTKAGDTFHAKQQMLNELKEKYAQSRLLTEQGIFARNTTNNVTAPTNQASQKPVVQTIPKAR